MQHLHFVIQFASLFANTVKHQTRCFVATALHHEQQALKIIYMRKHARNRVIHRYYIYF